MADSTGTRGRLEPTLTRVSAAGQPLPRGQVRSATAAPHAGSAPAAGLSHAGATPERAAAGSTSVRQQHWSQRALSAVTGTLRSLGLARAGIALIAVAAVIAPLAIPRVNDAVIAGTTRTQTAALVVKERLGAPAASLLDQRNDPEARMVKVLMQVSAGELDSAAREVDALIADTPNFRLAHLVKGDLLLARARALRSIGTVGEVTPPGVRELEEEARARMRRYTEALPANALLPRYLLQLGAQQSHAIVVDTKRARLLVYAQAKGGALQLVDDYYVTIGKNGPVKNREGDQRTPVGVYEVTDDLDPARLTDFYGTGAFPINYPNAWDQRAKRSGSGIWLHGVPSDTYSRPPRASNGCVVLANSDLEALRAYVTPGVTPVVIADELEWAHPEQLAQERAELQSTLEQWRKDWESRDLELFGRHYHESFRADGRNLSSWLAARRNTVAAKQWVSVQIKNVSMFGYPGNDQLAVVSFDQDYQSNNYDNAAKKRQYWLREGGAWRIVYEGLDS